MSNAFAMPVSGRYMNLFDPSENDIDIVDIAWGLQQQRWGSQLPVGSRTVSTHCIDCVLLYLILEDLGHLEWDPALPTLLLFHDAHEAYCLDVPTPFRRSLCFQQEDGALVTHYEVSERVQEAINKAFRLPTLTERRSRIVRSIDRLCALLEYRAGVEALEETRRLDLLGDFCWPHPKLAETAARWQTELQPLLGPLDANRSPGGAYAQRFVNAIVTVGMAPRTPLLGVRRFLRAVDLCRQAEEPGQSPGVLSILSNI